MKHIFLVAVSCSTLVDSVSVFLFVIFPADLPSWEKSPKNSLKECVFCHFGTQNTVPCCQKYTPTVGDFAHWV